MFIFLEKHNFDWVYKYLLELNFEYIRKPCCSCSTVLSLSEWLVMDVVQCSSSLLQCLSIDDLPRLSIDDLPECLLIKILTRLLLKSIFQCRCVSRQWCSLISAPSFAYIIHRLRSSSILQRPSTLVISHYNDGVRLPRMLK